LAEAQAEKDIQVVKSEMEASKLAAARETASLCEAEHRVSLLKTELAQFKLEAIKERAKKEGREERTVSQSEAVEQSSERVEVEQSPEEVGVQVEQSSEEVGVQVEQSSEEVGVQATGSLVISLEDELAAAELTRLREAELTRLREEVVELRQELSTLEDSVLSQPEQASHSNKETQADDRGKDVLGVFDPGNWVDEEGKPIGSISFEAVESELTPDDRQRGNQIFQTMERYQGGPFIDRKELTHAFSILNKADINVMFAVLDANKDSEISLPAEWENYLVIKKREKKSKRFAIFLEFLEDSLSKCDRKSDPKPREKKRPQIHAAALGDMISSARSVYDAADEESREVFGKLHQAGTLTRGYLREFIVDKEGLEMYFHTLMSRDHLAAGLASYGEGEDGGQGKMPREEFAGFFVAAALRAC